MYKLGPIHQGIMERGCKTGSFSYLLWPSRVGAFTAVIGKHYANFDTADFPFSYINEEGGKSTLVPGMNFFTVGTLRDGEKWPSRDRRKTSRKLDLIIFDVLSPYTAQKMIRGQQILLDLYAKAEKGQEYVTYNGINIKRLLLKTCSRYYGLALDKYFGDLLAQRVEGLGAKTVRDVLKPDPKGGAGDDEWVDLCGLLCSKKRADALCSDVESGKIKSQEELYDALLAIYNAYKADEWNWFLANYRKLKGRDLADESGEGLTALLNAWKEARSKLVNMVLSDAEKEFVGNTRTGFGIDGHRDEDFEAVRGSMETNKFVKKLKSELDEVTKRHQAIITKL